MRQEATLLHELPLTAALRAPESPALIDGDTTISYAQLAADIRRFANGLAALQVGRGERVAIYLDKRIETVVASFGAPARGAVFVPINPLLKAEQVGYILRDCGVRVLVTTNERLHALETTLAECPGLAHVIVLGSTGADRAHVGHVGVHGWSQLLDAPADAHHRIVDNDTVGILYTSGSTGKPKGVVLSHRNMVCGAKSVASYLENRSSDVLLAALPEIEKTLMAK